MLCSDAVLEQLEYPRLKELLAGQTQSQPGGVKARQLQPLVDRDAVDEALSEVDEAVAMLDDGLAPALGSCPDISVLLTQIQAEGSMATAEELLPVSVSLRTMDECRSWFRQQDRDGLLSNAAAALIALSELRQRLKAAIGSRGELLDSASFVLGDVRAQIRQTRSRIKQRLEQMLSSDQYGSCFQERLVTQRNGRYVVPLKSDHRGQIKGFVQDESSSGQTLYLEPTQVLEENNRLQQLRREEQREERRILLQLTDLLRRDRAILLSNQELLARIDMRFAAARLSRAYQGCRPELVDEPLLEVKQARHPLLMERDGRFDMSAAVGVDLLLPPQRRALLISGPNTGGKSVALKTAGLHLLMLRSGLHVPCDPDSRFYLFGRLHVDMGDEQSIEQSLSTFSGHLVKMRTILESADEDSLVLLDEAGSGTDPAEGAALIQALLDQLCEQGARTLATTHLGQLKHYAHGHEQIENGAVEFDPQTLAPTYRLRYGVPGASSALATAQRMGLPQKVLESAERYLGTREQDHSALLQQLNRKQLELEQQLEEARKARLEAQSSQQLRLRQLNELRAKKKEIYTRAAEQAQELISSTEAQMKVLRKKAAQQQSPQEAAQNKAVMQQAREQLKPFQPQRRRSQAVPLTLERGELVRIAALGITAEVVESGAKTVQLLVNGKRMKQPLKALEQFSPRRFAGAVDQGRQVTRSLVERQVKTQLKLVGKRAEEALAVLVPFVDDALLNNLNKVEIVHGSGAGVLRRVVREFLASQAGVTAFYAAPAEQGGENITIVELGH